MSANIYTGGLIGGEAVDSSGVWGVGNQGITHGLSPFDIGYLVIAGGGGSGLGGAGAGGYRSNITGENSGGGASAETAMTVDLFTSYTITVGAGGAATPLGGGTPTNGNNSVFNTITSTGGGVSGHYDGSNYVDGSVGGSGGGGGIVLVSAGSAGTANQGYAGGTGDTSGPPYSAGGGGGAGAVGANSAGGNTGAAGGNGVASSITGTSVTRAGGGGGGGETTGGAGGSGGGGVGSNGGTNTGSNGTINTGGGAGGQRSPTTVAGYQGGSGIVILKVPDNYTATFSGGVTFSVSAAVAGFKIYTVTATSTTSETVTFS